MVDRLNMRLFFQGALCREEVASAWLATLLEQHKGFRAGFLKTIGLPPAAAADEWAVQVEKNEHDVHMESGSHRCVVVIENKIGAGAVQQDQLRRYYSRQKEETPNCQVVVVFLTPRPGVGRKQSAQLQGAGFLDPRDFVSHIAWDRVAALVKEQIKGGDPLQDFAETGLCAIERVIDDAQTERYPLVGDRVVVEQIVALAADELQRRLPSVKWCRWRSRTSHVIYTARSNHTVKVSAKFQVSKEDNLSPLGVCRGDEAHLTLQLRVQLSVRGKRKAGLCQKWKELLHAGTVEIPGIGRLVREDKAAWMRYEEPVNGTKDALSRRLAELADTGHRWAEAL